MSEPQEVTGPEADRELLATLDEYAGAVKQVLNRLESLREPIDSSQPTFPQVERREERRRRIQQAKHHLEVCQLLSKKAVEEWQR